jgi:hypothetical protein
MANLTFSFSTLLYLPFQGAGVSQNITRGVAFGLNKPGLSDRKIKFRALL